MPRGIYLRTPENTKNYKLHFSADFWKNKIRPKTSEKTKLKIREIQLNGLFSKGVKSWLWKGENVSYGNLHKWVRRWKGKAKKCEHCGIENIFRKDGRNKIHWANIDGKYRRDLNDYISLCCSCHKIYDGRN